MGPNTERLRRTALMVVVSLFLLTFSFYSGVRFVAEKESDVTMATRRIMTLFFTASRPVISTIPSHTTARPIRKEICDGCFRLNYKNIISPKSACSGRSDITMVMIITSVPENSAARRVIRNSWAKFTHNNTGSVRYVFLFGVASGERQAILENESQIYDDILQDHYIETYKHLSVKVLMGLRWVISNCPTAAYVMRAADDTYVNVPGVVHLIQNHHDLFTNKLVGHCVGGTRPIRKRGHKWYVSYESYPKKYYPPYCIGTTFMMTLGFAMRLVVASKDIPFFELEDVYFGLVLDHMKVDTLTVEGFDVLLGTAQLHPETHWLTLHKVAPLSMSDIWSTEKQRMLVYKEFFTKA